MKKIAKLVIIILALFITIEASLALYRSSEQISAKFDVKEYALKINTGGGNISTTSIVIKNGGTVLPTPTRDGYDFLGFSSSPTGSVDLNTTINDISTIENKEIYTKWNAIDYNISYNLNVEQLMENLVNIMLRKI